MANDYRRTVGMAWRGQNMTTTTISNSDDVIDSRDVIARIEELGGERDYHNECCDDPTDARHGTERWADANPEDAAELTALQELASEGIGSPDWSYGETLIRESYFKDYAQELAEDCGMLDKGDRWPYTCIDWDQAAKELRYDYSAVEFDGVTYLIRS